MCKHTKLNTKLDTTLKQCVSTRWNSILTTLKSVADNIVHLRTLSADSNANKKLLRLMLEISEPLLNDVIKVLQPFDVATKLLSTNSQPSVHLVAPTKCQLAKQIVPLTTDSVVICQLKKHLGKQVEQHLPLANLHCLATLLDPRLKNNTHVMSSEQRSMAINSLRQMLAEAEDAEPVLMPRRKQARLTEDTQEQSRSDDFFGDMFNVSSSIETNEVSIETVF